MGKTELVEQYRIQCMLDQATDMVSAGKIKAEDAVILIGNLVDMDAVEPSNELEKMVFDWFEKMEEFCQKL